MCFLAVALFSAFNCLFKCPIGLGQTHPALLLMRQWCQSFNHLFRVTHNFGEKEKKIRNQSNKYLGGVERGQDPTLRKSQEN